MNLLKIKVNTQVLLTSNLLKSLVQNVVTESLRYCSFVVQTHLSLFVMLLLIFGNHLLLIHHVLLRKYYQHSPTSLFVVWQTLMNRNVKLLHKHWVNWFVVLVEMHCLNYCLHWKNPFKQVTLMPNKVFVLLFMN